MKLAESLLDVTPDVVATVAAKAFCLLTMACCFSAALLARSVTGNALMRAQSACVLVLLPFLQSKKHDCDNTRVELFNDGDASSKVMKLLKNQAQLAVMSEFCDTHKIRSPAQNSTIERESADKTRGSSMQNDKSAK